MSSIWRQNQLIFKMANQCTTQSLQKQFLHLRDNVIASKSLIPNSYHMNVKKLSLNSRRRALLLSSIYLFVYGFLSSFSTSYGWILFLRFLVGFSIGCVPQSVTLFAEFLPTEQRAKCVILMDCFWALGACLEVLLAGLVMTNGGWRWLLALSSLPSLMFVIAASTWLPESARFNAASGHSDSALETLERIAEDNGKPMLLGRLIVDDNIHLFSR